MHPGRGTALSPLDESLGALGIPSPGSTHYAPEMGMSCRQAGSSQAVPESATGGDTGPCSGGKGMV